MLISCLVGVKHRDKRSQFQFRIKRIHIWLSIYEEVRLDRFGPKSSMKKYLFLFLAIWMAMALIDYWCLGGNALKFDVYSQWQIDNVNLQIS